MASREKQTPAYLVSMILIASFVNTVSPASVGSFCKTVQGEVPNAPIFTWYIPVLPSGTSVTPYAKVAADLILGLFPTSNLVQPPLMSSKYKICFGGWNNAESGIGAMDNSYFVRRSSVGILTAAQYVPLWVSWSSDVISGGTGNVVGQNTVMKYTDPTPTPINFLLIGGYSASGYVTVTYCYQPRLFDQMSPTNQPALTNVVATILDCGRTCDEDNQFQGYSVTRRHVTPVGSISFMIYRTISDLQRDPDFALYVVRNQTLLTV